MIFRSKRVRDTTKALKAKYKRDYLSYQEAAFEMGIDIPTLKQLIKKGELWDLRIDHIVSFIEYRLGGEAC